MFLVTGGCGFIGSNLVRLLLGAGYGVLNVDKLSYSGNLGSLSDLSHRDDYTFVQGDIADTPMISALLEKYKPGVIFNLAAESHVDKSIDSPSEFVQTNLVGTFSVLEAARRYWRNIPEDEKRAFKFIHVSTDEVYGSLLPDESPFTESTPYRPSSVYSATKAGADHLAMAYHATYNLPVIVTNCSNN
ncbi:MAG: GDP-mannose 4,6-dehydratase, partial [Synergistaceae bacterium]|nr:GDP-mannose 4,6-dehydratase [Synergistaceae bacterium]